MRRLLHRLRYVMRSRRQDDELAEEIAFHREMKQRELEATGAHAAESRDAARRALGNELAARQYARDVWLWPWLQELWQDVRFGVRILRRQPGFAATAILVLGFGIGVNNMMFTMIYAHTLRPLPFDRPERVLHISRFDDRVPDSPLSYADFQDLRAARSFATLAAFSTAPLAVGDEGRAPDRFEGAYVSADGFVVINREPAIGRSFVADDDRPGAPRVALLGETVWRDRYGADRTVVGRSILIEGQPTTVIGIVPNQSGFPTAAEVWLPLWQLPGLVAEQRDVRTLRVFGRLRDGVSATDAAREIETMIGELARRFPDPSAGLHARVVPLSQRLLGRVTDPAWLAFISIGFLVLAASCANLANLMLASSASRAREIAIRGSLGASRRRIVGQLLIEALVIAVAAGIVGLAVSVAGARGWRSAIPDNALPYWLHYQMDARVFAALVIVSLVTIVLFGLVPALQSSSVDVNGILKDGGRSNVARGGARRWTTVFLAAQIALSVVLVANGLVGIRNDDAPMASEERINTPELLTASLSLPAQRYPTATDRTVFYERLTERVAAAPGVAAVAFASSVPAFRGPARQQIEVDGDVASPDARAQAIPMVAIGPGYFDTLGVPLEHGRDFTKRDASASDGVAIVGRRLADVFFSGKDPVGRRMRLTGPNGANTKAPWLTIVGVAQDIRQGVGRTAQPVVYVPLHTVPLSSTAMIVRTRGEHATAASLLRDATAAIDSDLPLYRVMTMKRAIYEAEWNGRVSQRMIMTLTLIALVYVLVGLYAVSAHAVAQRTHEIGIRMALGAPTGSVRLLVLRRAMVQVGLGLGFGILGTLAWDAIFFSGRADVTFASPMVLGPVCLILAVVTLAACAVPMHRAARLDPMAALKSE